jgi:hypothetical protein
MADKSPRRATVKKPSKTIKQKRAAKKLKLKQAARRLSQLDGSDATHVWPDPLVRRAAGVRSGRGGS